MCRGYRKKEKTHSLTSILFCSIPGLSGRTTKYSLRFDAMLLV